MFLRRWTSPADLRGDAQVFKYGLLRSAKTGIRLARIQPGSGNKGIAINLVDAYVTGVGQIPYDALSYTWGEAARTKDITCNGKRLTITHTLLLALHRFRDPHQVVTLWIDQICICQERIKERNQQVQLMGKIFKGAREVVVWLGEDYNDSRAGMQLVKQLLGIARHQPSSALTTSGLESHGLPKRGHRRWVALSAILKRPWFWRAWVVQEVVLNPNVELILGSSTITWDDLEIVVTLLEGPVQKIWQLDQAISASELPFSRINRIRLRHQRLTVTPLTPIMNADSQLGQAIYAEPEQDHSNEGEDDDPQLLDLLLMSRALGATDARDKIYALLGLTQHDIDPDYSLSAESVFTDFALQTLGVVTHMAARRRAAGLEISSHGREVRRMMILLSCAGRHNQVLTLPSWVPDWTVDLSTRPLVFGAGKRFAAGGDQLGLFDWHPDLGLQLSGKLLDVVHVAGTIKLDTKTAAAGPRPQDLIEHWWQEAQRIALSRTTCTPGSTSLTDAFENLRRDLSLCRHGYFVGNSQRTRRNSLLDELDTSDEALHSASQTLTLGPTRGRILFASTTGWLGLAPYGTLEGDVIFVALGADVPYVLRPFDDGYEFIGEAYVQGIMDGELVRMEHIGTRDVMIR